MTSMKKELYIIESKLDPDDDKSWTFLGAFPTSKKAGLYYRNDKYKANQTSTVPWDLPENYSTYFDKFIYCEECDKYPYHLEDNVIFLIQKNHNDKWHFDCLLPTFVRATSYINICENEKGKYKIIPLKLPYHKNKIHYKVNLERSNKTRDKNKLYKKEKEGREREEKEEESYKLLKTHDILIKVGLVLLVVNIITTYYKWCIYLQN